MPLALLLVAMEGGTLEASILALQETWVRFTDEIHKSFPGNGY